MDKDVSQGAACQGQGASKRNVSLVNQETKEREKELEIFIPPGPRIVMWV
jgi:hypothetical protein